MNFSSVVISKSHKKYRSHLYFMLTNHIKAEANLNFNLFITLLLFQFESCLFQCSDNFQNGKQIETDRTYN